MDWTQVMTILGGNIALMAVSIGSTITLFLWARSEARSDQQEIREIMASDRRDLLNIIREIQAEMKDFHSQLIKIQQSRVRDIL